MYVYMYALGVLKCSLLAKGLPMRGGNGGRNTSAQEPQTTPSPHQFEFIRHSLCCFHLSVCVCLSVRVLQAADLPFLMSLLGRRLVEVLPQIDKPFQNYSVRLVKEMMADGVVDLVGRTVVSGGRGM